MSWFTTKRERLLWIRVLVVQTAIYATLGLAGTLTRLMTPMLQKFVSTAFLCTFIVVIITGIWAGSRPSLREIGVAVGIVAAYALAVFRMTVSPVERTHLFEYGVVAILVHQALIERARQGGRVPVPAVLAIVLTSILGLIDEFIQYALPNRIYDPRDVLFNVIAALLAISAAKALSWARQKRTRQPNP
ncbi:MAG: VanZ family protein [Acidobacteriota bacterium]|nr:VanZ family protein [Acidobacteriota bacterium]